MHLSINAGHEVNGEWTLGPDEFITRQVRQQVTKFCARGVKVNKHHHRIADLLTEHYCKQLFTRQAS